MFSLLHLSTASRCHSSVRVVLCYYSDTTQGPFSVQAVPCKHRTVACFPMAVVQCLFLKHFLSMNVNFLLLSYLFRTFISPSMSTGESPTEVRGWGPQLCLFAFCLRPTQWLAVVTDPLSVPPTPTPCGTRVWASVMFCLIFIIAQAI